MKRIHFYLTFMTLGMFVLGSCNGEKQKAKEFGETVARYIDNENDTALEKVYPDADFEFVTSLPTDSISVTPLEAKGQYRVNYGSSKWIDVRMKDNGDFTILDSRGLADLPADRYDMAMQTGMIDENTGDIEAASLLKFTKYFNWLNTLVSENIISLEAGKPVQQWGYDLKGRPVEGGVSRVTVQATNKTSSPLSADDYSIRFSTWVQTCSDGSSPDMKVWHNEKGVALAPGETASIKLAGMDRSLGDISVIYNIPADQLFTKYYKGTGKEYQEYVKKFGGPTADDLKEQEGYNWLSERSVTPEDLQGKSKEELRIMRNWIYARHGYIFQSPDLTEYFSKYPWYSPSSKNVTGEMNKTELQNINIIKSYE